MKPIGLCLAVAIGACSGFGEPTAVRVQTDAPEYMSASPRVVGFTIVNSTDHSILISRCGDHVNPAVDRWDNGGWVNFYSAFCLANVSSAPLAVGEHATYADSTGLFARGVFQLRLGTADTPGQPITWTARLQ